MCRFMGIIGVDTSGKLGQFPVFIGVVKTKKSGILDEIRKSVSKRKLIVSKRRRVNVNYLTKKEIKTLISNVDYSVFVLSSPVFSNCLRKFRSLKDVKFKILGASIYYGFEIIDKKQGCYSHR